VTLAKGALIAVTGGTGAIGRLVVPALAESGHKVRLLSRSGGEAPGVDLAKDIPSSALEGCSAVLHLASHIPTNQEDPASAELCFRTNALGTLKLLEAAETAGVSRFVQTTSANAYAPGLHCPSEDDPMYPAARAPFYLASKIAQDVFGAYWNERRGLPVTTLRLSSVYGAAMEQSLFTRFAKTLLAGQTINLANGGSFGADFVDVSDVVAAIRMVLESDASGAFNIASGQRTTLLDAAKHLLEFTGSPEDRLSVTDGPAEPGFPAMNISKARGLGFQPTGIRTGLERLVEALA